MKRIITSLLLVLSFGLLVTVYGLNRRFRVLGP